MTIDLSKLTAPNAIVAKSYETILGEIKADLITKNAALSSALDNESEPLTQLLQVSAYREALIRQEFNDRTKGLLLAYATGSDLDHIGVTYYYTQRLVIDPGNPTAVPPIDPVYESDDDYRARCLIAEDAFSTAGPAAAYIYHAKTASGDVLDISVTSPNPVEVVVTILSRIGDGTPDAALLIAVEGALTDNVRPLTDQVTVQAATIIDYTVNATLTVYAGIDQVTVQAAAQASLAAWVATQHLLGRDITITGIHVALRVEGVHDVALNSTVGTDIIANQVVAETEAAHCSGITVIVGGVGD